MCRSEGPEKAMGLPSVGRSRGRLGWGSQGGIWEEVPKNLKRELSCFGGKSLGKPLLITYIDATSGKRLQGFSPNPEKRQGFLIEGDKKEKPPAGPLLPVWLLGRGNKAKDLHALAQFEHS